MSSLPQSTPTTHALTRAHLRAFIYGDSMKPGRPAILRHSVEEIAQAMVRLPAEDAARCLALLPAGVQIPVVARLNASTRARLEQNCTDWAGAVPILRAYHGSVAKHCLAGQMTPIGRI
ncbi:MAG: hypothetical protein ACXIUW_07770 [Roseinatronobacter sp.]